MKLYSCHLASWPSFNRRNGSTCSSLPCLFSKSTNRNKHALPQPQLTIVGKGGSSACQAIQPQVLQEGSQTSLHQQQPDAMLAATPVFNKTALLATVRSKLLVSRCGRRLNLTAEAQWAVTTPLSCPTDQQAEGRCMLRCCSHVDSMCNQGHEGSPMLSKSQFWNLEQGAII